MSQRRQPAHSNAKRLALCGVLSSLSLLFLLGAGLIPFAVFTGPFFASLCLIPVVSEFGPKTSFLAYLAISILAFILVGNKEVVLFFILLTGYYPILQPFFTRLSSRVLRVALKFFLFLSATAAVYLVLLFVFSNPALMAEFSGLSLWFWLLWVAAGTLTFFLYDILVDKVRIIYLCRFRKIIFR